MDAILALLRRGNRAAHGLLPIACGVTPMALELSLIGAPDILSIPLWMVLAGILAWRARP